jgi:AcrR family transcriptional regulator
MSNQSDKLSTKEKIVQAAVVIMTEEGFQNITIRKIAAQADVNVAAINYHFGSKDAVINEALKTVTDQLKDTFESLKGSGDPKIKLARFIDNYTSILFKYPDILKNMINHAILNKPFDHHAKYVTYLQNKGIVLLRQTIAEVNPDLDDRLLYLKTLHLVSCLSFPILMGDLINGIMRIDLYDEETLKLHTAMLLENVNQ